MKINYFLSKIMLILGLIFFSSITAFVTLSCSSGSDSSMAGLILMSGENNGTPTPTPAPVPTPEPNEPKPEPAPDPEPEPTPTPAPNDPVIDESTINWDKTITLNTNCISVNDVNLIFQTTSIPDDSSKSVVFDGTLHISYNKTVKRVDTSTFTLPFNSYSDATPKGYQLKINLKQIFADAVFVSGDVVKISLKDVSMKTENVKFIQMVIVDSSEAAGWYKYLSATHEENIWTLPENQPELITNWTLVNDFNSVTIASGWEKANWTNGNMFNCWWDPENITFNESGNSLMKMKICQNSNPSHKLDGNIMDYNGAELRTTGTYGYGYYEVRMKPCKASGTNSSFFLYTRDDGNNIEWNEVDIEFITKDMGDGRGLRSIPQFNFFIDNAGEGHELLYTDLKFDASTEFHVYGIEYAADHISWYVDGKKVYTAAGCEEGDHNHAQGSLPRHNMQIMVNFWPGTGVDDWLGEFHYTAPLYAEYDYIKFKAKAAE